MGSKYAVSLYQADFEKCCVASSSSVDPVIVASNLLLDNQKSRKLRIVSPIEFKPWYDCTKLVPLSFKFQPPNLTASSVPKSNPSCDNKAQTLPSESLLEFLPKYSGKSCQALKFELNRCSCSQSGSDEGVSVQWTSDLQVLYTEDHGLPIQYNQQPTLASTGKDSSGKNKLLQEVLDPLAKSHWCASPSFSGKSRKEKDFVLEKFKEINLQQVKDKYRLNYHQRGKWIISKRIASLKGNNLTVEQLWKKVRSLIKESYLPHCNGIFQKTQGEVWVYCDFKHSLKVRSTLEKALGNVCPFPFCVHGVGQVIEL